MGVSKKRVGVISLGCDKNRVDTEKMLGVLVKKHKLVNDILEADVVIINTCAFLRTAREEAISEILEVFELKKTGAIEKIIVTGCLPQKFISEIYLELREVDAFLGVSDYKNINDVIDEIYKDKRVNAVGCVKNENLTDRVLTTYGHAYLKIADGCSNHCTYCLIPKIRGAYYSIEKDKLIEEAKSLGEVEELILVAQDLTKYGADLENKSSLPKLLRELSLLDNIKSIRLLYCYPEGITDELIDEFKVNDKLIKYIDMPLQHADDKILKLMNRKGTGESYKKLIVKLKTEIPEIAIRSTFIAGFPGETEENFNNLVEFLKDVKLFNAAFFKYSREEDTPAYKLPNQVMEGVKTKRVKKLYSTQKLVVKDNLKAFIGKTLSVIAEGFDEEQLVYYGRAYFNAPDVDGKVYFFSSTDVEYGKKIQIKILKATGYDLYGERL